MAGCGGGGWSSSEVEQEFRLNYPELADGEGGTSITNVTCSKNQGNEFSCNVELATGEGPRSLVVIATCEDECVWRDG
jgi:hypothetical protein